MSRVIASVSFRLIARIHDTFLGTTRPALPRHLSRRTRLVMATLEDRTTPSAYNPYHYLIPGGDFYNPYGFTTAAGSGGFIPSQIRHAYGIDLITFGAGVVGNGAGQTIAIVDAYNNPTFVSSTVTTVISPDTVTFATSDLHNFDVQLGIADPPSFIKVNQTGGTTYPANNSGWGTEIALDVEWAHAIAPAANILLVEASSSTTSNLNAAVTYARSQPGVVAVTMSYGGNESAGDTSTNSLYTTPGGHIPVTFLASTGDTGAPGGNPAFSPNVVAVGGTTLSLSGGNYGTEVGWSGSGGGISTVQNKPSYQSTVTQSTTRRTIPDVSLNANSSSGVAVYDSNSQGNSMPWIKVGGTSFSSPAWAGIIAIADQGRTLLGMSTLDGVADTLPKLYSLPAADFHDITSGNNGFAAGAGYDLVTGRGTPIANLLVSDLVGTVSTVVTNTNDSGSGSLRSAISVANIQSGTQTVTFDPTVFASAKTITLTSGELLVSDSVTITGPTAGLTISGNTTGRVFNLNGTGTLAVGISNATITGGSTASTGGAIFAGNESLTLDSVKITGSTAASGGGIALGATTATLTVRNSTISGNTGGAGGGVYFASGGGLLLQNSTISGNVATLAGSGGGGINFNGTVAAGGFTISNSTLAGNTGSSGGGLNLRTFSGTATIQNSTISANSATTADVSASGSGGGGIALASGGGSLVLASTIDSGNAAADGRPDLANGGSTDVSATFSAIGSFSGFNFAAGSGNNLAAGANLNLGALANNGSTVFSIALGAGSAAIDAGMNAATLATDSRQAPFARTSGAATDIGAYEVQPLVVDSTGDTNDGVYTAGQFSLREALALANTIVGANTILFSPTVFATPKTITLGGTALPISDDVTVIGPGANLLTVSGNSLSRVINNTAGTSVALSGLTISNGRITSGNGAGIFTASKSFLLDSVVLSGNSSASYGGAVAVSGPAVQLTIRTSTLAGNTAVVGGGIALPSGGSLLLDSSTLSGNVATISGNTYGGGGIFASGNFTTNSLIVRNSTIAANTAVTGAAILMRLASGPLIVQNSTISGNTATNATSDYGTGGAIAKPFGTSTITLVSSIVAGNASGNIYKDISDVDSNTVSATNSAVGVGDGFSFTGTNANNLAFGATLNLGTLGNYGGATQTIPLLAGSAAQDAGANPTGLTLDQRGKNRTSGAGPDIGAYERQIPAVANIAVNGGAAQRSTLTSITVSFNGVVAIAAGAFTLSHPAFGTTSPNPATLVSGTPAAGQGAIFVVVSAANNATVATLTFGTNTGSTTTEGDGVEYGSLSDGIWVLTVAAGSVTSSDGATMASDFATDSTPGTSYIQTGRIYRIYGDGDGDADVDLTDLNQFRTTLTAVAADPNTVPYNPAYDSDADGDVDITDLARFRDRFTLAV